MGRPKGIGRVPPKERFMKKVERVGECWRWTGGNCFRVAPGDGRRETPEKSARLLWPEKCPTWLPAHTFQRTCENEWCVNPAHVALKSLRRTHCENGHPMTAENRYASMANVSHCRTCHTIRGLLKHLEGRTDAKANRMRAYWERRILDPQPLPRENYRAFSSRGAKA